MGSCREAFPAFLFLVGASGMGGHIIQKWYEFKTGDQETDRYG